MRTNYYVEDGATLAYIKAHGRCAITGQPFNDTAAISGVLLPQKASWPLPVWGDYPMGLHARQVAFIIRPASGASIRLRSIKESTQCDGRSIAFHPVTFKTKEANETASLQEV